MKASCAPSWRHVHLRQRSQKRGYTTEGGCSPARCGWGPVTRWLSLRLARRQPAALNPSGTPSEGAACLPVSPPPISGFVPLQASQDAGPPPSLSPVSLTTAWHSVAKRAQPRCRPTHSPLKSSDGALPLAHKLKITGQPSLCALVAPSPALTMETLSSCWTASLSELVPTGYLAQVFPGCPEVEGLPGKVGLKESEQCDKDDLSPGEESGQNRKKTKVNKIWNFVSCRKGASSLGKRPQSMILLEDTSRPSELKPKVTLMDRTKSFKRLKPSTGASKNTDPRSSKTQETQEAPGIYQMRKAEEARKPFRHSYAGHIEGLETFLADVQRLVHTPGG
ncbi:uncharacterized protein LOC131401062 [Diceros bicornis minor]|uniref:uncharacterized protein LOC131401062 n=1 Tax=Diceros bicornis minor TaxID=77932 RepID=UPI0026EECEC6|nr:uncharacterized protein LOC131401062 [Diceros bicornis minor]